MATAIKGVKFTQDGLLKLVGTTGNRLVVKDPKTIGLRAELREGGTVAFYLFRRIPGGSPIRFRIGPFPDVSVEQARAIAADKLGKLLNGENIAATRRVKRSEATLTELFTHWLEHHAKAHKRTWADDKRQFDKYLAPWHKRKLSSIAKPDVAALHARLGTKHGRYQANRVLSLLRALFNKADDLGYTGGNPAAKVKPFKEESRDRFLQPAELPKFFAAVNAEPSDVVRDFFLLALWTGQRRGNVAAMRWADVDLEGGQWRLSSDETKQGKIHYVPLAPPALAILKRRKADAEKGAEFVLPSYGAKGHIVEVKSAWQRIIKRAGLSDLRPHDLRRTLGSYQAITGASLAIIGAALGHSNPTTTQVYARLTNNAVAESVTKATAYIEAIEAAAKPVEKPAKKTAKRKAVQK
jgi:integrase